MRRKICFVALNIYPVLQENSPTKFMGGAEVQQVILADSLKRAGHEVSFVTCAKGGRQGDENLQGVKVVKAYDPERGLPFLRFFYPRSYGVWNAMKRADADIYYQRGASYLTGIVALFCKMKKKAFLFAGAHDRNFIIKKFPMRQIKGLKAFVSWKIYLMGLKSSCHVLVQTFRQKELLKENYNIESDVFENIYPVRSMTSDSKFILWVGTIKNIKQPWLFLDLADQMPDCTFVMIGGSSENCPEVYKHVLKKSRDFPNLRFLGFQTLAKTEEYFDKASVFVNTSEMEGFPNTFLQAWSRGIPTVSYVNVDKIIQDHQLGAVVCSQEEMKHRIAEFLRLSPDERRRIQKYFEEWHSEEKNGRRFAALIEQILDDELRGSAEGVNA